MSPPLSLPLLAALTPSDVDVRLIDENVERVDVNTPADWVAMTCMTASAPRAYELADGFRKRGVPVVVGGIHPSVMPDEASARTDAVAIGEAEPVWRTIIEDLAAGRLRPRYDSSGWADLTGLPIPRRDLLRADRYVTLNVVQTARGCPHGCSFCSVTPVFGRKYRFRPIPEVVDEVRSLSGWIGFVDDNICGHPGRGKELFEALIPLKIKWVGQGDLSLARDPELLALAARSGCQAMFMGLESVSQENLRATGKSVNLRGDMGEAIGKIHRAGIEIIGSFVLGLDGDDTSVFDRTVDFAKRHKLLAAQFAVLTPFPGTVIRRELEEEGRIGDHDWARYTMSNVVFRPKQMTAAELTIGQGRAYGRFYSIPSILRRSLTLRGRLLPKLVVNLSYRGVRRGSGVSKAIGAFWKRWRPAGAQPPLPAQVATTADSSSK
ncbi:MAG: radical SAM protein [Armatimonadota bacterium]|nr:radical SAM protein [Armatimonadota bacterium]